MRKAPFARWLPQVSHGTLAALLLAAPIPAAAGSGPPAAGFAGSAVVVHGNASITVSGGVQTVTIPTSSAVTTINWTPTDTAVGAGAIDFLPQGNTVSYVGTAGATTPYTVLNRIIPADPTRTVAFNGAVNSTANTRVWFYTPGGLLIGSTATFNVGGLVLTTADPVTQEGGNFITTGSTDSFSVAAAAGSTSAITIKSGATIAALGSGQSNYIVAIAPQITQGGKISVAGSVALVAAESASFAVDSQGLFNITVSAGTTVADNTFVHTGSTGGPNAAAGGSYQRVYMVAVPKNNAITMAIASSGSIGFAVADAANLDGNAIVLSAGGNIADTGSGNPVVAGRAGSGTASLGVGGGKFTSNTYAVSTDSATVTDPARDISFASNLAVAADDRLGGVGGTANLQASGGSITVGGNALVSAVGAWSGTQNSGGSRTQGGTAQVSVNNGGLSVGGSLTVDASGDATGSNAALISAGYNAGANATGGSATVTVSGPSATLSATGGITANANAISGIDGYGEGGEAAGGTALIEAASGGTIGVGLTGAIRATATATAANLSSQAGGGYGGASFAGTAQVIANAGKITVAGVFGITADANAIGGTAPAYSGSGGSATGGMALIATQGPSGSIATNTSGATSATDFATDVSAVAVGADGNGYSSVGGSATGGTATLQTTGANQSIAIDHGQHVIISADATAGHGAGYGGGSATGGTAQLLAGGGSIAITRTGLTVEADATGGYDDTSNGGDATGGTVRLAASGGGVLNADLAMSLGAFAAGGNGSGTGGNAVGGNIFVDLGNNAFNFAGGAVTVNLDASYAAGAGSAVSGTGSSAGGVLLTDLGTLDLTGSLVLNQNTPLYVQAGGSIDVAGSITESNSSAYAHLWADDLGTGAGTVTLAKGALNLPGSQIDIYYNPAALGTPTDFSAGIGAGTWTGYQLVDNIDQLQLVGSYLSQNFALGRNIDASATQGWNGGAGFVPIGTYANGFVGNFDGLNHAITNLTINNINANIGLFGALGAGTGAQIIVRNVGLVNPQITGSSYVGGLAASIGVFNPTVADNISVTNSYTSGGAVSGINNVGGLVGIINGVNNTTLTNIHSDTAVTGNGSSVGGLVGFDGGATITNAFATGTVTDLANGASAVGGLIGQMPGGGTLSHAYATGAISTGTASTGVGGLIGQLSGGTVTQAYAVGSITAGVGSSNVGGLVGQNEATISESWASGAVSALNSTNVSGFVGLNSGTITNSYWDTYSTGQVNGVGTDSGTTTALNSVTSDPTQTGANNYAFNYYTYTSFPTTDWTYDNVMTRPVGAWEAPVAQFGVANIASAHQVQLIDLNLGGSYLVTQNIDMRGTGGSADIWGPRGFMPLGIEYLDPPFTGTLEGAGHVLANLTMSPSGNFNAVGLIQDNYGTISDIGLANVAITASNSSYIGAIAGINAGQIIDSFATGTITLTGSAATSGVAGGLAGQNFDGALQSGYFYGNRGTITQSYATVAVSGGAAAGGLVGDNEGGISGSYANGPVSGTQTGGLVGESIDASGPTVTNSYWDAQSTGQTEACGSAGYAGACSGATALTTAETLQSASFIGFTIDTQGGQGLPWRQYEGNTTPLLEAFLIPISVQPGSLTMQYNGQTPDVGVTTYGAQPSLTFGTAQVAGLTRNAGTTELTYAGGLYSNQAGYDFVPATTPGTLIITPAPLTLAAVSQTRVYDATTNSSGEVQASGLYGEDSVSDASQSFTSPNVLGTNRSVLVVNNGYLINDGNGGNNYIVTLQGARGTITPAALTLAAVSDTKVYDATTSSNGVVQVSGLFGTDSVASLTQSFTSPNAMGTNGSTLVVNPGYVVSDGNGGGNYTVALQSAQGTITPAQLMLTLAAVTDTKVFDGTTNSSGVVQTAGLMGTDNVSNLSQSFTSPNVMGTNGSTLVVNPGYVVNDGNGGGNYTVTLQGAQGTITPAAATITYLANPLSSIYGNTPAGLSGRESASGLVIGDTLGSVTSGTAGFATAATGLSPVGSYAVTGSGLAGNTGNYSFSFVQAPGNATALTIVQRALTLTADPLSRPYGSANPASDTATAALATATTGLVNGDSVGSETVTSPATSGSGVGVYRLDGSAALFSSGAASNYAITYASREGGLSITPAALTLTYTADPGSSTYGQAPAGLTGSTAIVGLVNGDTAAGTISGAALWTSPATAVSNVGTYAINGSGIALANTNYALTSVQAPGNATALTVNPAPLSITYIANPLSSIYGNAPTGLSGTESATGLVNGDTLETVTSGTASYATAATSTSNVGAYAVTGLGLAAGSGNYNFSFAQAPGNATALTIAPRPITVTADPQLRQVGAADPLFTYAVTGSNEVVTPGLVNGDTLTGRLAGTATITSPAGQYDILQGTLAASANYRLTYVGNILTLTYAAGPIQAITNLIETNLPDQAGTSTEERRKQREAADLAAIYSGLGLHPPQISQSMINDRQVTTPPPVNEPVTSNGNSSLWGRGAP